MGNNELGKLENRYVRITLNKNGKLIFEPTQVVKSLNTYFTEIAEWLQCTFIPGTHWNKSMEIKNFLLQYFLHPLKQ
jgi:hypothetical protein